MTAFSPSLDTPRSSAPAWLTIVDQLLRDRSGLLQRIERDERLAEIGRACLIAVLICAGIFGASMGFYRGGVQVLLAAVKFPLVILLTAALCTPALTALRAVLRGEADLRRDACIVLCTLALGSAALVATTPLVLLAVSFNVGYHALILLVVMCCAMSGAIGLIFLGRAIFTAGGRGRFTLAVTLLGIVGMVGAQMAWTLRPYVVRPREASTVIVRSLEGSFFDSVATSLDSARGIYYETEVEQVW